MSNDDAPGSIREGVESASDTRISEQPANTTNRADRQTRTDKTTLIDKKNSDEAKQDADAKNVAANESDDGRADRSHEPLPSPKLRLPHPMRALRHRNFRLFFAGQFISLTGTWMQSVAEAWLVYRLTGSAVMLGVVGFASQIPVFVFVSIGGAIADRFDRHRVLVFTQASAMLLAFLLAALTLTGVVQVGYVIALAALLGLVNAVDMPVRQAFVVDMVGRQDVINAIALNSSMFNGARIVGPAIAGMLVALIGEGWCFFANAVSYIAVIVGLLMMDVPRRVPVPLAGSALAHIAQGFTYVAQTSPVRALLMLLGLMSLMGMPFAVLMPIFAQEVLHGTAQSLGILMGASGVGALMGAMMLAARKEIRGLGRWVAGASASFGVTLILFSLSRTFWLSAAILIPTGFSMMVSMAASNTLIQSMIPDHLRGRVMAIYSMMFMGMAPIGALLAGVIAERVGAPVTVAVGGVACIVGASIFAWRLPHLRHAARQLIIALEAAAGQPVQHSTGEGSVVASLESE